ncbi:MAG: dihydroorotase [Spirochaetaceae bacterium]|jgi:dihydroorotase|nr:dihydroorotase [Spirochaetaceae bacterium]
MITLFDCCRIVDDRSDFLGHVAVANGVIVDVIELTESLAARKPLFAKYLMTAVRIVRGRGELLLMPGFVDMHAHFREPGFPEKETLESASLAAARGGWTTVVCMANTNPAIDTVERAAEIKRRSDELGLTDLHPALSLTKGMMRKELSDIAARTKNDCGYMPLLLSEDGNDVADDELFLSALRCAAALDIPVSCHCDVNGEAAAIRRAINLGLKAGCKLHIAHVSTKESVEAIENAKWEHKKFALTAEATPHHLALTKDDALRLGENTFGAVAPPLRSEDDRSALLDALDNNTIDAIATDHAPHTRADKEGGAPGFSGLETALPVVWDTLIHHDEYSVQRLSYYMSASPARILGLKDRGYVRKGMRADIVVVDPKLKTTVKAEDFFSRGKNSPFIGKELQGKILMTMANGRIVYSA